MPITMTYEEARSQIKSGDIVNLYRPSGFGMKWPIYSLINFFAGSPIYHNVVAIWMTSPNGLKRLMCVEANLTAGRRIVPLSIYANRHIEVMPLPSAYDFAKMEDMLLAKVAIDPYALRDFAGIGIREFFGFKKPARASGKGMVCSELCATAWVAAGFPFIDTTISPGRLKGSLMELGVQPSIVTEEIKPH